MELSKRLYAIAQMVKEETAADIGTDHGYLPIFLVKEKGLKRVIACDVNKGPLKKAEENIAEYGVGEYIETRLGDGLERVKPGEAQCITISGMGGMLIIKILSDGIETVRSAKRIIVQPQHDIPRVRQFIMDIGFMIEDEAMVFEDGKYYTAISAVKGSDTPYDEKELLFGRRLIERKDECLKKYIEFRLEKLGSIIKEIEKNSNEDNDSLKKLVYEHTLCEEVYKWL